ncbi:penicillin-binding protein 1B [Photobacterium sp. GJ3]|uniref:penicillin-binding protein 1B n=1 Tax=Photobacterium sp. GJ3 TaxID=2829502 RepID=UPI002012BD9A|nr:penicillin-binding protein 1B [Photobacterium sp. GJ3]
MTESVQQSDHTSERYLKNQPPGGEKPPRRSKWKMLVVLALMVILGMTAMLGLTLNQQIEEKFSGQLWQLPSVVYARELVLEPGAQVRYEELVKELEALNYRKVSKPTRVGEYSTSRLKVEFIRRPFQSRTGPQPARHVSVSFDYNTVRRVVDVNTNREYGIFSVEPQMLGMLETDSDELRLYQPKAEMPATLIDALLVTEDRDYYTHDGVSVVAIGRAFLANMKAGRTVQGGSTLTQQLAKNLFLSSERSFWRKFKEAYMAMIIDYRYNKDEVLDAYLNQVYLAQSGSDAVHGFALGSRFYFGLPLSELRVDQQALLVGMVKGPSYYNPWRYPERAKERRDLVLSLMHDEKKIDEATYQEAIKQGLDLQPKGHVAGRQPAFFSLLKQELNEKVSQGYQPGMGLRVYTTLDPISQANAENVVRSKMAAMKKQHGKQLETAVVVADRQTGEVRAMVGGSRPEFDGFNRALDARRQIGSVVKPAVYLSALARPERFSLGSNLDDKPLTLTDEKGKTWSPRNYDRQYRGEVPLVQALARSYNIPTVNLGMAVGLDNVISTMEELGVDPAQIPHVPAILLGAFTLSPYEVTQMYQTIANEGRRSPLTALSAVTDRDGKMIYQHLPSTQQVVSKQSAWLTMYAMQKVVTEGTARYLDSILPSLKLAGKTGTSDEGRDSWYVGVDGREVVTVWMGRDDNKNVKLTGSSGPLRLYSEYIQKRDPEPLTLKEPKGMTDVAYQMNQQGGLTQACIGQVELPVWDKNGRQSMNCENKVSTIIRSIFNW